MQFLAARSLWTNLLLERYSIPMATSRHIVTSIFTVTSCVYKKHATKVGATGVGMLQWLGGMGVYRHAAKGEIGVWGKKPSHLE